MQKMLATAGLFIGSWIGGLIGSPMGLMMMVVLSSVGAGLGLYAARRICREYFD